MAVAAGGLCELCAGGRLVVRGWSILLGSRRIDSGTHKQKQIDDEDRDENEAADEDVGAKSHDRFVFGEIGGWDVVVLVVAFVMVFGHADKLTWTRLGLARGGENILSALVYSSRPGRDMSSRMASLGLLLRWRMASICSVMGISTA
jgi:hypothetical protein